MTIASILFRLKNEARHLGEVLRALERQTLRDYEIVVVDSSSTDGTLDLLAPYAHTLRRLAPDAFTYGRALNLGAAVAKAPFLVNLSGHSLPRDEHWLEHLVAACAAPGVAGTCSRLLPYPGGPRHYRLLYRLLYPPAGGHTRSTDNFHNASSCVRLDLWRRFPFDEKLAACEDLDWARRVRWAGYQTCYVPASAVYHAHEESALSWLACTLQRDAPAIVKVWLRQANHRAPARAPVPRDERHA